MASKPNSATQKSVDNEQPQKRIQILETTVQEGEDGYGADILRQLVQRIGKLEKENKHLKAKKVDERKPARHQVFHRFSHDRMIYLGEPSWSVDSHGKFCLKGNDPIADSERYLERNKDVVFVINRSYTAPAEDDPLVKVLREAETMPAPKPTEETLQLVSDDMIAAVEGFLDRQPKFSEEFPKFSAKKPISAPYLFWYHYRSSKAGQELHTRQQNLLGLLTKWIDENYEDQYAHADAQFAAGFVSRSTMKYLVRPGDVLIKKGGEYLQACLATSWTNREEAKVTGKGKSDSLHITWNVTAWSYGYHGSFYRQDGVLVFRLKSKGVDEKVDMQDLNVMPLRFASDKLRAELELRGKTFWSCRNKRLVSYQDDVEDSFYGVSILECYSFHNPLN